jgi:hypothetical protein
MAFSGVQEDQQLEDLIETLMGDALLERYGAAERTNVPHTAWRL